MLWSASEHRGEVDMRRILRALMLGAPKKW